MASRVSRTLLLCLAFSLLVSCRGASDDQKIYVVYMGEQPAGDFSSSSIHTTMLEKVAGSRASGSLLHSYKRSFNGFAAKLTKDEAQRLAGMEGVVSVFPSEKRQLHTTRSWDFMGFPQSVRRRRPIESDLIIGMLDTGIWPESESFSDDGFGPLPSKWRGSCQTSSNFTCNNKIIGARFYRSDSQVPQGDFASPRDTEGHGSHTSSIAAGALVTGANLFGFAEGTARGGVPSARIAMYKVCWSDGCYDADILAAFDDAIADGVDIISVSIGAFNLRNYFEDPIAIGAFHSMKKGILTSNSAGNDGPDPGSITNVSPWSLSVAASTIDRKFTTKVQLGNGQTYQGVSVNTFELGEGMYPMIYGGDAPNIRMNFNESDSRYCRQNSLDSNLVKGKIVLCDSVITGETPLAAGALGSILQDNGFKDVAYAFPLPTSYLNSTNGEDVFDYLKSTSKPTATILKSEEVRDDLAPAVVSFSSRGPNPLTSDLLKPDLTAPGVDILAAWSLASTVTRIYGDNRHVPYNIISGTSMSCPHATGAAAYVKSFWPTWSPAAIKSALMTTASPMSDLNNPDAEFAFGSGQINPVKALNPGLVYDAGEIDYVKFLCGQGITSKNLRLITGDNSACSDVINGTVWDLNYPSFALSAVQVRVPVTRVFHRTVTNVGSLVSTYRAVLNVPAGLEVEVEPSVLSFKSLGQKMSFTVTVKASMDLHMISGILTWSDGVHSVRSPIVAYIIPDE